MMKMVTALLLVSLLATKTSHAEQYLGLDICNETTDSTAEKLIARNLKLTERSDDKIVVSNFPVSTTEVEASFYFYKGKLLHISLTNNLSSLTDDLKLKYGKPKLVVPPPKGGWTYNEFHYRTTKAVDVLLFSAEYNGSYNSSYLALLYACVPLTKAAKMENERQERKEKAERLKKLKDL